MPYSPTVYTTTVTDALLNKGETGIQTAQAGVDDISPRQVTATLGAAYTLAMGGDKDVELIGALGPFSTVPTSTVTLTGLSAGMSAWLRVTQPSPGGCSLVVSDGTTSQSVPIAGADNATTMVLVRSPNGTDLDVVGLGGVADASLTARVDSLEDDRVVNANAGYGAFAGLKCDGTDDSVRWADLIANVPEGTTLLWRGNSTITSTVTFNRRVNPVGVGLESAITVVVGATVDGVVFDSPTAGVQYGVHARNFCVLGGASAARYAVVIRDQAMGEFDFWVKAGATWEVSIEGSLINTFRLKCPGNNMLFPYAATTATNGIRLVGSAGFPPNANTMDCIVEARTGIGVLDDATVGSPGAHNNFWRGTYEGISGIGIHLKGCQNFTIRDVHLEAGTPATQNGLRLENCIDGDIGGGVTVIGPLELINTDQCVIDGIEVYSGSIDAASARNRIGRLVYQGGGWVDRSATTTYTGPSITTAGTDVAQAGSGPIEGANLLRSRGLDAWDTVKPLGSVISIGTITKTGDGQADTRKLFGTFAGKMSGGGALYLEPLTAEELEFAKGRYVAMSAWVYIPSGQAAQPTVVIESNIQGVATNTGQSTSLTDQWVRLSIVSIVSTAGTQLTLRLRNTNATSGDWYADATSVVLGVVGPRTVAPRTPIRRSAETTWDPAAVATGAVANVNITVQGAAIGDWATASMSTATGNGVIVGARVIAANTVQVTLLNHSGVSLDLASGSLRVEAWGY